MQQCLNGLAHRNICIRRKERAHVTIATRQRFWSKVSGLATVRQLNSRPAVRNSRGRLPDDSVTSPLLCPALSDDFLTILLRVHCSALLCQMTSWRFCYESTALPCSVRRETCTADMRCRQTEHLFWKGWIQLECMSHQFIRKPLCFFLVIMYFFWFASCWDNACDEYGWPTKKECSRNKHAA